MQGSKRTRSDNLANTRLSPTVSLADLAEILGVSLASIYRMRDRRELPPHIKAGRQYRWRPEVVEKWLEEQEQKNAA